MEQQRKVGELVQDFNIYPRASVDTQHLAYIKNAIEAGVAMPPLVICAKSARVVDGFHRCRAFLSLFGSDHLVDVIERRYKNEAEILLDAMRMNSAHGRTLSRFDRVHCALLSEKLELTIDETASALSMTVDALKELRTDRVASVIGPRRRLDPTPLKQSIRHMSGKTLTPEQVEVNTKLSGMNQLFHVNQLVMLIESGLLDLDNAELIERLNHLANLIRKVKSSAA